MEAHPAAPARSEEPRGLQPEEARRARRQALAVFAAILAMTAVEVAVARAPAGQGAVIAALLSLAVAKAALVGLFFMHLGRETPALRWTALAPLLAPGVYGIAVAADAAWRMLR